jgi:hypothetical protein
MNLLTLRHTGAGVFSADPSEIVHPVSCNGRLSHWSIDRAMSALPHDAFDYLWLIDPPQFDPRLLTDMKEVASGPGWYLFRINRTPQDREQ